MLCVQLEKWDVWILMWCSGHEIYSNLYSWLSFHLPVSLVCVWIVWHVTVLSMQLWIRFWFVLGPHFDLERILGGLLGVGVGVDFEEKRSKFLVWRWLAHWIYFFYIFIFLYVKKNWNWFISSNQNQKLPFPGEVWHPIPIFMFQLIAWKRMMGSEFLSLYDLYLTSRISLEQCLVYNVDLARGPSNIIPPFLCLIEI